MTRRRRRRLAAWVTLVLVLSGVGYAVWLARSPASTPSAGTSAASASGRPADSTVTRAPSEQVPAGSCTPAVADGIPVQPGVATPVPDASTSRQALAGLTVAPRTDGASFCRGRFGPDTWPDLDANGCSTRQDVLVRQATTVSTRAIASHGGRCQEAISGTWIDPYTGETMAFTNLKDPAQAQLIQIDHVVSLYNAWVSGASRWTDAQRVIFANDLAAPELQAVAGAVNFAKDHAGAEAWQPPAGQCAFARAYVEVKRKYDLSVTARERDALDATLGTCPA